MKKYFIFITIFILLACINVNAQNNKLKYLLVEVYADSSFIKPEARKHDIEIYSLKKNNKQQIKALPQQIFCFSERKNIENILLKIEDKEFSFNIKKVKSRFAVLKVYINENATSNSIELLIKNGDLIYRSLNCTKCHKIEIVQLSIIVGANNNPTTGNKVLDEYILK